MAKRSKVELYEQIRKAHNSEELSIRGLAGRFGVHRRTVREALASPVPVPKKVAERPSPVLGPWKSTIDEWLAEDLKAPKKQRHTARRIWERLVEEHDVDVAEGTVRRYVAKAKGRRPIPVADVMVPQTHLMGDEAEVDFGQVSFRLCGELVQGWMFVMRLSASGKGFHRVYANQAQEAFFDGHVRAFSHLGGVPRTVRYDNLRPAVAKVMLGRNRQETDRFKALRSHYLFDSFYCRPGKEGAHEKGGVEGEIGRFRRRHLVPMPKVCSITELNGLCDEGDRLDDLRRIEARRMTVAEHFALERPHLRALSLEPFDVSFLHLFRVDAKSRVCVRQNFYSVPVRYAGMRIVVRLSAETVEALDGSRVVARHARAVGKGTETLELDHYIETLKIKLALAGSTALHQARKSGRFGAAHDVFFDEARRRLGERDGTKALIGVLLAHRVLPYDAMVAGIEGALAVSSVDPDVVVVEARRVAERRTAPVPISGFARFDRPAPSLQGYDDLLEGSG